MTSPSATTSSRSSAGCRSDDPGRPGHLHRRRERLRQVDSAASTRPAAEAEERRRAARRGEHPESADEGGGHQARLPPASAVAPEGITVADLVSRGRYPYQRWFRQWTRADEIVVTDAMRATGTVDLATRPVDELSGGQRQRAWIAMALAQDTDLILLDEPTTYLDLAHQVEVLDLLVDLNVRDHRTIVLVLHDLNQAARYSDHIIAMKDGAHRRQRQPGRGDHRRSGQRRLRPPLQGRGGRCVRYTVGAADRPAPPQARRAEIRRRPIAVVGLKVDQQDRRQGAAPLADSGVDRLIGSWDRPSCLEPPRGVYGTWLR